MADFSIALQEAWTPAPLHLRFSRAMLTEIQTLAEAVRLAHKGSMPATSRRDESKWHE
ncbi:methyltransferase [Rhizobium sophorae]|uniref:Methyltransferase n=2 Tax=Rhizobium TaxID=379 RepID=A0ABR6A607_9HYPH|nr:MULTISPECIES: methyltransferase [Rhizobium]MBX4863086.1 methyltransferase [Rhizobium bangladeshense]MBA5802016.1 methyltransferase [Rhizobium changzhiense]MCH4548515.1 methyltransferase [Rhizobium changzhiense]MCV9944667.1 methyltransferase [Rhizobium sp. BT-175]MCW0018248.1 methyltransferase [Rhizobium sp. BT-226]